MGETGQALVLILQKQSWETFKKWDETGHGTSVFAIDFQKEN